MFFHLIFLWLMFFILLVYWFVEMYERRKRRQTLQHQQISSEHQTTETLEDETHAENTKHFD